MSTSAIKSAGGTTNISSNDLVESAEENNNLEESKISSNKNDDPYILGEALVWILGTAILCIFAWILQPLLEWVGWIAPIAFFLFFPTTFGSTKKQEMRIKEREINQANYLSEHNVNKSIDVMYNDQLLNKCIRFIADEINRNIYISQSVKKGYTGAPVSGKMEETGAAV